MKKIFVLILCVILCVGVVGCAEKKEEEKVSSVSSVASGPSVFVGAGGKKTSSAESSASSAASSEKISSSQKSSSSVKASSSSSSEASSSKKPQNTSSEYKDPIPANAPRIICWGDSITQGMGMPEGCDYPAVLQRLLGYKYRVLNAGSGGEKSQTIAARQGAYEITIDRDLVFDAGFSSAYFDDKYGANLILKDGTLLNINEDGESFKNDLPCNKIFINGKEYTFSKSGGYLIAVRKDSKKKLVIKKGAKIVLSSAKAQQGSYCEIFYIGANDGVQQPEQLVARYKAMAKRQGSNRFIVIIPQWDTRYTEALKAEFGDKALDIREEICARDPNDFGLLPSAVDLSQMRSGKIPTMYKYQYNENDSLHLNENGYMVMATIIYEHGIKLGYWK